MTAPYPLTIIGQRTRSGWALGRKNWLFAGSLRTLGSVVVTGAAQVGVVVRQQGQVLLGQRQVFQPLA